MLYDDFEVGKIKQQKMDSVFREHFNFYLLDVRVPLHSIIQSLLYCYLIGMSLCNISITF